MSGTVADWKIEHKYKTYGTEQTNPSKQQLKEGKITVLLIEKGGNRLNTQIIHQQSHSLNIY